MATQQHDSDGERWYTTTEVADKLGFTSAWVLGEIKAGRMAASVHVNPQRNAYRISQRQLDRYVAVYMQG